MEVSLVHDALGAVAVITVVLQSRKCAQLIHVAIHRAQAGVYYNR
jgi:hypothetical protein